MASFSLSLKAVLPELEYAQAGNRKLLGGSVLNSELGGRATTRVYVEMGGSAARPLRESTESRCDIWKLLESCRNIYDTKAEMIWGVRFKIRADQILI